VGTEQLDAEVVETVAGVVRLRRRAAGGVGKSALLRMFADKAAEAGFAVVRIDGHDVRPNSESFLRAAGPGVGLGPVVVLVDTYELLEPLDDWLREEFVPALGRLGGGDRRAPPASAGLALGPGVAGAAAGDPVGESGRGRRDTLPGRRGGP
jgi:hypothetical protein